MKKIIIPITILVLVYLGYYLISADKPDEVATCTKDALACPDGSVVGRSGEQCSFKSCPNMEYIIGTLEQNTEGFRMVIDSPMPLGQEVAYAMPIEIKVTSALGELVGKRAKAFGVFGEGNTLIVERLEELSAGDSDRTLGSVKVGQTVFINGVRISLNKVVQDSRCPTDVVCIWAGAITANVTLKSDTDTETRDITSNEAPTTFDSYLISIEGANPAPVSTLKPEPKDYTLTFKVISR